MTNVIAKVKLEKVIAEDGNEILTSRVINIWICSRVEDYTGGKKINGELLRLIKRDFRNELIVNNYATDSVLINVSFSNADCCIQLQDGKIVKKNKGYLLTKSRFITRAQFYELVKDLEL